MDSKGNNVVVVIGIMGSIGHLLAQTLAVTAPSLKIVGIDIDNAGRSLSSNINLIIDDITQPHTSTCEVLASADTIIFALSEAVLCKALPVVVKSLKADALIVETLSTKNKFLQLIESHRIRQQIVGINPMFSGDLNPKGRPVAAVVYKDGILADNFLQLLKECQLNVVTLTADDHDRAMATLQALVHATVLLFGKVLTSSGVNIAHILQLAPPPFLVLMTLLARMTQNNPDVYWEIQTNNLYATDILDELRLSLTNLVNTVKGHHRSEFDNDLAEIKNQLIAPNPKLLSICRQLFDIINTNTQQSNHSMHLQDYRGLIDQLDDQLIDLLSHRLAIVRQIAQLKKENQISVMQTNRVQQVKLRCKQRAENKQMNGIFVEDIYQLIINEACRIEEEFL